MDESIIGRLRAALDQAQTLAENATPGPWKVDDETYAERIVAADNYTSVVAGGRWGGERSVFETTEDALHIAAWSPDRVLRLIASHRQLLEDHKPIDDGPSRAWFIGCNVCSYADRYEELQVEFPCADVRRVAEFWLGSTE